MQQLGCEQRQTLTTDSGVEGVTREYNPALLVSTGCFTKLCLGPTNPQEHASMKYTVCAPLRLILSHTKFWHVGLLQMWGFYFFWNNTNLKFMLLLITRGNVHVVVLTRSESWLVRFHKLNLEQVPKLSRCRFLLEGRRVNFSSISYGSTT